MHQQRDDDRTIAVSAPVDEDAEHAAAHAARRAEIAEMTPAQRFRLMHDLCSQITWLASARRVP